VHAYAASGRKATLRHIRHIANVNGKRQGKKKITLQGNKWEMNSVWWFFRDKNEKMKRRGYNKQKFSAVNKMPFAVPENVMLNY
jgi:hypothetical protein